MAASTSLTFAAFDSGQEVWISYTEWLKRYLVAHGIDDDGKRRAVLLSVCGVSMYQLICNLVAPGKPTTKSFEELVKLVKEHHDSPPSAIVQRFKFNFEFAPN
jgi:hypothetical protein